MAAGRQQFGLSYAARSDVGMLAEGNGDSGYAGPFLVVVADGSAGRRSHTYYGDLDPDDFVDARAEIASTIVIDRLRRLDREGPPNQLLAGLEHAAMQANDDIRKAVESRQDWEGLGTTLTAMLWSGNQFALVHSGDSRAYLLRDETLFQITHDHTLTQSLVDEGEISADEAPGHPQRLLLLRALDGRAGPELDLQIREAKVGDRYLLCTDGLWRVLSAETIFQALAGDDDPERAVRHLIDLANRGGGPDNITCAVIDTVLAPAGARRSLGVTVGSASHRQPRPSAGNTLPLPQGAGPASGPVNPPPRGAVRQGWGAPPQHAPSVPVPGPSAPTPVPGAAPGEHHGGGVPRRPSPAPPGPAQSMPASPGRRPDFSLSGYTVFEALGEGGNATVYKARRIALERDVAIKVVGRRIADDRDRRRFRREVDAAVRLSEHPNVVTLYDADTLDDGRPYLVMELCLGGSLADQLRRVGPMTPGFVREVGVQIADAVAAAHEHGVLHRDIKPANLLVTRFRRVALADFGIAALPVPGQELSVTLAMTPVYAAPEVFDDVDPAPAADIYSLGATLYALLAGRAPRAPDRPMSSNALIGHLMRSRDEPIAAVEGVPEALMAVLRRALRAEPDARYRTAGELRDALGELRL
ncbi:protein kinase [Spirillospora sp. NPDC048911]|uniref:bifunctional protein-serine/threonine kinase/phosphatase n=1 Tax=Spirillospora sp. NPDC048911 TaxID=3364527 RepID=UPI0037248B45